MNAVTQPHTAQEHEVLEVFNRHFAAFNSGDLDAVLQDFGEDSVVMTPDGVFKGRDQIRAVYRNLLAEFGAIDRGDSPGLVLDALYVHREMLFITWHAESKHHVYPFGTDTFVCRGGQFERQSIAFSPPQPR